MEIRSTKGVRRVAALLVGGAAVAAVTGSAHITPTVVLHKQADVIRTTLPAASYFVRTVDLGKAELRRIKEDGGFKPEDTEFKFFYGKDGSGEMQGVVLFPQVNTQHGPLEVGVTLSPEGRVTKVTITKATVETKPWILKAVKAGLTRGFVGMKPGDDPARALDALDRKRLGEMPYFMAETAARAVGRGLVLYRDLFEGGSSGSS